VRKTWWCVVGFYKDTKSERYRALGNPNGPAELGRKSKLSLVSLLARIPRKKPSFEKSSFLLFRAGLHSIHRFGKMPSLRRKSLLWMALVVVLLYKKSTTNGFSLGYYEYCCEAFAASGSSTITIRRQQQQQQRWREPFMMVRSHNPVVDDDGNDRDDDVVIMKIQSPVLQRVYPLLIEYVQTYGHPNIPLKTPGGRQCVTLRRLYTQQTLNDSDVSILDALNFTWHSYEDTYVNNPDRFEEFVQRLRDYGSDLSPPKKYAPDPELGAWVTGIRRLYTSTPGAVDPRHVRILTDMGFAWTSPRKCASSFMKTYRTIVQQQKQEQQQEQRDGTMNSTRMKWQEDPDTVAFIRAQQQRAKELSPTRQHYMEQLLGSDWQHWKPANTNTHHSKSAS
jgi:hypothetical protein